MIIGETKTVVYQESMQIDFESVLDEIDDANLSSAELFELKSEREKFKSFWERRIEAESGRKISYTIGVNDIHFNRNDPKAGLMFSDEWILIDRAKRIMNHYYIHNERGAEVTEFPLDRTSYRDITVEYDVDGLRSDRKTIFNYDCYRIIVKEIINDEELGQEIRIYDMYVTDQIDLPFHLLNTTLKPIVEDCPLEMEIYRLDKGTTYATMNAIEIIEGVDIDSIKLPSKFEIHSI